MYTLFPPVFLCLSVTRDRQDVRLQITGKPRHELVTGKSWPLEQGMRKTPEPPLLHVGSQGGVILLQK